MQRVWVFVYPYIIFTPFISFLVPTELPCLFVFLTFPIRSNCRSSRSVAISRGGLSFHSFAALLSCFPLSLVCFPPPSPFPLKDATITIDKPQVYIHKLHPVFLCPPFFSVVLHELSVLEAVPVASVLLPDPSGFSL